MRIFTEVLSCALGLSLTLSGCALTPPPRPPEDERALQRARSQQREASAAREQLEGERLTTTSEIERLQADVVSLEAPHEAAQRDFRAEQLAFETYGNTIEAAGAFVASCDALDDPATAAETGATLAGALADFVAEPERDEALKSMDRCRRELVKQWRKQMKQNIADLQREFAIGIEDTFDENNPYSKGSLTTKIKGTTLAVRMRGNFEGRARHSQDQVDLWCVSGSGLFTKITLDNSHGSFTCKPENGPSDLIETILEEARVDSSWVVVGEQPTPSMPDPPPPIPAEVEQRRAELLAEIQRLQSATAQFDTRATEFVEQEQQSQRSITQVDRRHSSRQNEWKQRKLEAASNTQIAGGVFVGIGGAVLIGTVGASQTGAAGARDFIPIGIGVSVPVIVTGILLLVGGGVRKQRIKQLVVR
jgi:uncharacterized small protein (DUF1192 family)